MLIVFMIAPAIGIPKCASYIANVFGAIIETTSPALIFFFCDQSPREEYPIIVKTLEDSLGLRKLFDSAENG